MSKSVLSGTFSSNNFILNSLSGDYLEHLIPHLEPVELTRGNILHEIEDEIRHVYFPSNAMISVVNVTSEGFQTEVGVIGREGFSGIEALLNGPNAINRQMIQLPGVGHRIPVNLLKDDLVNKPALQGLVNKSMRAMLAQISQTALCNRLHRAEERLAKWLLMCHDRVDGDVMPITQEFAAIMLGANRTSVTLAAGNLQDSGFINYTRGKIAMIDRAGLEAFSCECYEKITNAYARLYG